MRNELDGEEVALASPLLVRGVVEATAYDTMPPSLSISVTRVEYRARNIPPVAPGRTLTVRGPLGIELPRGVPLVAALRPAGAGSFAPAWVTSFAGVAGDGFVSFVNARQQLASYSTADPHNLFGCLAQRRAATCRRDRLVAFGVTGNDRLRGFDRLAADDRGAALLWMSIRRTTSDPFPTRLCTNASDVAGCASDRAFAQRLNIHPIQ